MTRFYPDERSEVEEEDDQEAAVEKILLDADHQGLTRDKVRYLESLFKVPPDQFYIDLEELTYEEGKYVRERFRRYLKEVVMRYPMAAHLTVDFDLGDQWVRYNLSKPEVMEKIREFLDNDNNFKIMFELETPPEDYQYQNDYTLPPLRIVNKIQFSKTKNEMKKKKSFKDRGGGFLEYLLPDYTAKEFEEVMKRYQVFTRLTKEGGSVLREELDDNCFIWALKQANIPEDVLNRMRLRVRTRYISKQAIYELCEEAKIAIEIVFQYGRTPKKAERRTQKQQTTNLGYQGEDAIAKVKLACINHHYFLYEEKIPITNYYVQNMKEINEYCEKNKKDIKWGFRVNMKTKEGRYKIDSRRTTTSFQILVNLFETNQMKPLTYGDVGIMTTDLYKCIKTEFKMEDFNEKTCCKPGMLTLKLLLSMMMEKL